MRLCAARGGRTSVHRGAVSNKRTTACVADDARHALAITPPPCDPATHDTSYPCPYSFSVSGHSVWRASASSGGGPDSASSAAAVATRAGLVSPSAATAWSPLLVSPAVVVAPSSSPSTALFESPRTGMSAASGADASARLGSLLLLLSTPQTRCNRRATAPGSSNTRMSFSSAPETNCVSPSELMQLRS